MEEAADTVNNAHKRQLRRGLSAIGGFLLVFSGVIYAGFEFPGFAPGNLFYSPYYFVIAAIVFFIGRTYIKEKRMIWNSIGFFERSGLTTMHDVPNEDVGMTHMSYNTPDGERHQIKHTHPFAIPSEEGYDNVYLTPKNTVNALNPARLWKNSSGFNPDVKKQLTDLYEQMKKVWPQANALDPDFLTVEETENDDPDTLMQEFDHHVSDIRKGFMGKTGLKENWFYILAGVTIGAMVITFAFMGLGVNFGTVFAR